MCGCNELKTSIYTVVPLQPKILSAKAAAVVNVVDHTSDNPYTLEFPMHDTDGGGGHGDYGGDSGGENDPQPDGRQYIREMVSFKSEATMHTFFD